MLFEKAQDTMSLQEKLAYYLNGAEKTTEQHAALREKLDEVVKEINVVRDDLYLWNEAVEDVRAAIEKEQHPGADKSEDKDSGDSGAAGDGTPEVKGSGDSGAAGDSTPEVKGSGDSGVTGDPEKLETVTDEEIQAYIDEMFSGVNDDVEDQKKKLFQLYKQLLEKCTWEQIKNRKDFTTSGIPSSRSRYRTKIVVNSREKTDRTRGGQTGHVHHPRPEYTPDEVVILSKDAYQDANKYTATGKNVTKDLVKLNFQVFVTRYQAQIYKNNETGKEEHAPFPKGIKDEVNYDSSVGAFALMAHSVCRIPVLGVQRLMSEMSDGKLNLSSGMIWNQGLKFSKLALPELTAIKERIKNSPVVNIDHTTVNFNGARQQVMITVGANGTLLFQPVISKGKKGLVGSVLEGYKGISVSDHDKTLCGVGLQHQECLVHLDRTAKGVIKFDPSRAWPPLLRTWFYDAENYWDNVVHPS